MQKIILVGCFVVTTALPAVAQYGWASPQAELNYLLEFFQGLNPDFNEYERNIITQKYHNQDAGIIRNVSGGYGMCQRMIDFSRTTGQSAQTLIYRLEPSKRFAAIAAYQNLCPGI